MSIEVDMKAESTEKMNTREDSGLSNCLDDMCSAQGLTAKNGMEPDYSLARGFLPDLDLNLGGLGDKIKTVAGKIDDVTVDAFQTMRNIPAKNYIDVGMAAKDVAVKNGANLGMDAMFILKTKGKNLAADGKLILDLYDTVTGDEGKKLVNTVKEAWKEGEKNKQSA